MKSTQALRDAAILIALVLVATSVRVTDLPKGSLVPETHAGAPAAAQSEQVDPAPSIAILPAAPGPVSTDTAPAEPESCPRVQRLTVNGPNAEQVVVEIDLDPGLRSALGLCSKAAVAPATRTDKA